MKKTVDRVIEKEHLQKLSLYLEYVKKYDVSFFNKLIEQKCIDLNELEYCDNMVSPLFMKEALIYNLYYGIMNIVSSMHNGDIIEQNLQNQEISSDSYYLSIFNKEIDNEMVCELIVPADLQNNPLSVFLYDNPNSNEFIKRFLEIFKLNFEDFEKDKKELVLSRKYPKKNPLVVVKKI